MHVCREISSRDPEEQTSRSILVHGEHHYTRGFTSYLLINIDHRGWLIMTGWLAFGVCLPYGEAVMTAVRGRELVTPLHGAGSKSDCCDS
jgi:hypothetical protein